MKTVLSKLSRLSNLGKYSFHLNEEEWKPTLHSFLEKQFGFESFFNKKKGCFTKCACLKRLHSLDHALDYLTRIGTMNKKNQHAF
jgi:hypothetical protein